MKPIWIVDDDQSIRFVLERALLREDMPTRSFSSPREVLQALESGDVEQQPQVLVSDIRMPGAVKPNAVWSYDFVHDQLVDGRALRMLCAIDEYTRECLTIEVAARLRSQDVILTLSRLMRLYGKPAYIRSDNGAEFTAAFRGTPRRNSFGACRPSI